VSASTGPRANGSTFRSGGGGKMRLRSRSLLRVSFSSTFGWYKRRGEDVKGDQWLVASGWWLVGLNRE